MNQDLGEIYRENVDYIWRVLSHLGVRPADVADVSHDVFIIVKRRLSSFEGRSSLQTWIYGICVRTVSDYRGKAFRRREISHEQVPDRLDLPKQDTGVQNIQLREKLQVLLDELRPEQRDVFVLYEIEELTMKEVAIAIDCPLQTAYSRLQAARTHLKARLSLEGFRP